MKTFWSSVGNGIAAFSDFICGYPLFFLLVGFSTILCLLVGDPNGHALTGSISTLTNVGPSLGSIGSMGNYDAEPLPMKLIFSANMFLGRVEIFPVFAVISSLVNRKYQGRA